MIQYTVSRCRKNNALYGAIHGAMEPYETLCGLEVDENWFILTNSGDGEITCKKCLLVAAKEDAA